MSEEQSITWDQLHSFMGELRLMARNLLALEGSGHSLQPTGLVLTALRRQVGGGTENRAEVDWDNVTWPNRRYFFAAMYQAMQRALIDHARKRPRNRKRAIRTVSLEGLRLESLPQAADEDSEQVEALLEALEVLRRRHPQWAEAVEHRFYSGYTAEETARVMEIGERTVRRWWEQARLLLLDEVRRALDEDGPAARGGDSEVAD